MPDLKAWTDEELCRELAAQSCGGKTRLKHARWFEAQDEYQRRLGRTEPTEQEEFERLLRPIVHHSISTDRVLVLNTPADGMR